VALWLGCVVVCAAACAGEGLITFINLSWLIHLDHSHESAVQGRAWSPTCAQMECSCPQRPCTQYGAQWARTLARTWFRSSRG